MVDVVRLPVPRFGLACAQGFGGDGVFALGWLGMQSLCRQSASIADAMVDSGALGAAGKGRWLDVEVFDIRWLGANFELAFTTNESEPQQTARSI